METVAAVVLAAGRGQLREGNFPKVLELYRGKPILFHAIDSVRAAGLDPVVVVINHHYGNKIPEALARAGYKDVMFAVQHDRFGPANAFSVAVPCLKGRVEHAIGVFGDMPNISPGHLSSLADVHIKQNAKLTVSSWEYQPSHPAAPHMFNYAYIDISSGDEFPKVYQYTGAVPPEGKAVLSSVYGLELEWLERTYARLTGRLKPGEAESLPKEFHMTELVELASLEKVTVCNLQFHDPYEFLGVNRESDLRFLETFKH